MKLNIKFIIKNKINMEYEKNLLLFESKLLYFQAFLQLMF